MRFKRIITIMAFDFLCLYGNSQMAIGHSKMEIMQRYSNEGIVNSIGKDGLNQATFQNESMLVIYFFNETDICKETIICPLNVYALKVYKDKFNKEYKLIDANNWSFYEKNILHFVTYSNIDLYGMFWFHL